MEIIILLVLIFVNGLFVMSEIALVSARKSRLEHLAERGDLLARRALKLSNTPEKFLSAAQIGITLIAILTGVYSGERLQSNYNLISSALILCANMHRVFPPRSLLCLSLSFDHIW